VRLNRRTRFGSDAVSDSVRWIGWRTQRLLAAGFAPELAEQLAREDGVDIHALLELVDRGCPPVLAARILAPLDWMPMSR
jgi:hypothetical protein